MTNLRSEFVEDGIVSLVFDHPDSTANIFDAQTLGELESQLEALAQPEGKVRGLIIMSAKPGIFIAGADLHAIGKMKPEEAEHFIAQGQEVFNKLAGLPFPTVAAVHGAALGGGYELCLACDWRIASNEAVTKLGLPETKLGIIPAWGGCTRLPRLLSVPAALDIILGGKVLGAKAALRAGMIDEIVPRQRLVEAGLRWIKRGKHPRRLAHSPAVNALVDAVIAPTARRNVQRKTSGHYPAIEKALEVVLKGSASRDEKASLARERKAVADLMASETTRQLLRLFFLQEKARKFAVPGTPRDAQPISRVAVIGAGIMGAGIAQWVSSRGLPVVLRDIDSERVAAGMARIRDLYSSGQRARIFGAADVRAGLDRISPAATAIPLSGVDLVIEAAVEKMDVKKRIFQDLDGRVRPEALLATNTSALSITELGAATRNPERVVGLHFFNPVHKMQLVEVVAGRQTAPEVLQRAVRFAQRIGKLPVLVKDSPGFLVNRILLPYLTEAAVLFAAGVSVTEIDHAMLDFGMPMGPLRLIDEVGVDIALDVAATLSAAFPGRLQIPPVLAALLSAGMAGRKTGQGFYTYPKGHQPAPNEEARRLRMGGKSQPLSSSEITLRLELLMINEASRCLEEEIVTSPGEIDLAMVLGTGFAPFRGGPLRCADQIGAAKVAAELERLSASSGPQYTPSALLLEMGKTGRRFYHD